MAFEPVFVSSREQIALSGEVNVPIRHETCSFLWSFFAFWAGFEGESRRQAEITSKVKVENFDLQAKVQGCANKHCHIPKVILAIPLGSQMSPKFAYVLFYGESPTDRQYIIQ